MQRWPVFQAVFIACFVLYGTASYGQVLTPDLPENRTLVLSQEQFAQGHYALAAQSARAYLVKNNIANRNVYESGADDLDKARYILAICRRNNSAAVAPFPGLAGLGVGPRRGLPPARNGRCGDMRRVGPGDVLGFAPLPCVALPVAELFPRRP